MRGWGRAWRRGTSSGGSSWGCVCGGGGVGQYLGIHSAYLHTH